MKQGWIPNLSNDRYHWGSPYDKFLNNSKLKLLAISPAHANAAKKEDPSKALRVGSLLHDLLLNDANILTLRQIYKEDEVDLAWDMAQSVLKHKKAHLLIKHGKKEYSGFFKDPDHGFWCKIRTDIMLPDMGIMADVKSTADAHPAKFKRDIFWFKYHWQGWFYLRGGNVLAFRSKKFFHTFLIIAVEKKPPYGVMIYKLSRASLDEAEQNIMPLLETYKRCLDRGEWPSYPEEIVEV